MSKSYNSIKAGWVNPNIDKKTGTRKKKSYSEIHSADYDFGVDESYVKSFMSSSQDFFKNSENDSKDVSYSNSASKYDKYSSEYSRLNDMANTIRGYYNSRKGNIKEDDYNDMMSYLDAFKKGSSKAVDFYRNQSDFYSKFKSEDEYNNAVQAQKNYEDMLSYDVEAGQKEIDTLNDLSDKISKASSGKSKLDYNQIYGAYLRSGMSKEKAKELATKVVEQNGKNDALIDSQIAGYLEQSGYKSAQELTDALSEKKRFHSNSKRLQDSKNIEESATKSADYMEFSTKGKEMASEKNPWWMGADSYKNQIGAMRNNPEMMKAYEDASESSGTTQNKLILQNQLPYKAAKYMTENEYSIYSYYLGKGDEESAEKYLQSIEESLNTRQATKNFEKLEGDTLKELFFGYTAGIDQFTNGIMNVFNTKDDYIPVTSTQITSGMVREDLSDVGFEFLGSSFGQGAYDLVTTTSNMLPSILSSTVSNLLLPGSGAVVGAGLMGGSASGNAYQEMLNAGYDKDQARMYSTITGASEAGLQYLLGGIGKLGGKISGNAIKNFAEGINNAALKFAVNFGGEMVSEGFEEFLQDVLDPFFKSFATGETREAVDWEQAIYSGLLGSLSAGFMNSVDGIANGVSQRSYYKNTYGQSQADLVTEGLNSDARTLSRILAEKYQKKLDSGKNLSGGQLQRLVEANEKAIIGEDTSTITKGAEKRLEELGETSDVKKLAQVIAKKTIGEELSTDDLKVLNSGKYTERVLNELDSDNINSGQYSSSWAENLNTNRINSEAYGIANERKSRIADNIVSKNVGITEDEIAEKVSDTGKTEVTSNTDMGPGEEVSIKSIKSIKNGKMMLELNDGTVIDSNDVKYASMDEALVYESVLSLGYSAESANAIVNGFKASKGMSASQYLLGVNEAYNYGKIGYPLNSINGDGFIADLTDTQKAFAYDLGRADADASTKSAQTSVNQKKSDGKRKGRVVLSASVSNMTERQKSSLSAIGRVVSDITHNDVVVYESVVKDGKRVFAKDIAGHKAGENAPNGFYDPNTGAIYIDLHAGNNGEGTILWTASHELTHFIRQWSPEKFKVLSDFLMEEYGKKGVDVNELIQSQIAKAKRAGRIISFDTAYEEVVADSMSSMFTDTNLSEKLAKLKAKDQTLWEKIKGFFADLYNRIKQAYKGLEPQTQEAMYVKQMMDSVERISDLFAEALVDAGETFSMVEATLSENGISVDSETDSASIMSVRDVLDDKKRTKVINSLMQRFGVTKEEAEGWISAETSLASLILNPKYAQYLDYEADPDEVAIKTNSDYPQGTVDFSNICAKRREFTSVMNGVLRNFPNHIFAATDLAKIRTIMQEEGMNVPCGICYVEDRRQLDTIVAQDFIDGLKLYREGSKTRPDGNPFNANQLKGLKLTDGDTYVPSVYELVTLEGRNKLKAKNPNMESAWVKYNNARGMQAVRLLTNEAEYKRQILSYSKKTVQSKNDHGGLRIYSFSDAEMFHLIDIIQVITDSATVGLSLQGYTKVNEYAKAVKDTGEKLNRSLIPKGELGYHMEKGKVILDYDTVEGIDINSKDFFDNKDNPNIGNITIGVSDVQIRAAMLSDFVDQIIPFHTGQSAEVLGEKGIATWSNYKDYQTEKDIATGKTSKHQVNIYTEVLQVLEEEGKPINKRTFVEKFLQVCKENGLTPRFSQFLNTDANGDYVYTEGYHKLLVDFKTFAQTEVGEYLPQMPVKPIFDNAYITNLLKDYVKSQKSKDAEIAKSMPRVIERITNEIVNPSDDVKYSTREVVEIPEEKYEELKSHFGTTNNFRVAGYLLKDGTMLDFSGKHWGDTTSDYRQVDHRDVNEVLDESDNYDAMVQMIANGNIRLMPETGGICLSQAPTEKQRLILRNFIKMFSQYYRDSDGVVVDFDEPGGDTVYSRTYRKGTDTRTILRDIDNYFRGGKQSELMQFHTSGDVLYSDRVTDKETLEFLDDQLRRGEVTEVFRAMQVVDGKLYPPMAGTVNGKWQNPSEFNTWEMSREETDFDKAVAEGRMKPERNKKGEIIYKYKLVKGKVEGIEKGTDVWADYAPYIHTSLSALNDQFTSAYKRPNLVVVRGYVPNSEVTGGYKAYGAKKSVGETKWHSGVVAAHMPDTRRVILSRYFMPIEIVDDSIVAQEVKKSMKGKDIEIPFNVVTPKLRSALEDIGVRIGDSKGLREVISKESVKYSNRDSYAEMANDIVSLYESFNTYDYWDEMNGSEDIEIANQLRRGDTSIIDRIKEDYEDFDDDEKKIADSIIRRVEGETKYSDRVLMGSMFSGGGTLEAGLVYQMVDKEFAVENNRKIATVYTDNHGKEHMFVGDVRDFNSRDKRNVFYLHASPVCKNFSNAKINGGETTLDIVTAKATARVLEEQMPQVFTLENVKRYKGSEAYNLIIGKLDELGYKWDVDVYNSADYGAATSRERLIIRAVKDGELPEKPIKTVSTPWYDVVSDLVDSLPESPMPRWMKERYDAGNYDTDKPLFILGGNKGYQLSVAYADEPAPTLLANSHDARIVMPDGRVLRATPRVLARIQGLPDSYNLPKQTTLAYTVVGNGIPTQLTKAVMGGVLDSAYEHTHEGQKLYSDRDDSSLDTRTLLSNALAETAQNDIEKKYISQYQEKIASINEEQKKLTELRARIKELSFSKGPRDGEQIRKLQDEATKSANRINTFDKQLLRLEATKPLKDVIDREKAVAKKKAEKEGREALNAYRERAAQTQRDLMNRYKERTQKSKDIRERTELRHKIIKKVKELNNLLLNGDKDKHVPLALQNSTIDVLNSINMDTVNAESRIAKIREKISKLSDPDQIARLEETIDRIELQGENMRAKLDALDRAYREIKESNNPLLANSYDESIQGMITTIKEEVGDTPLRDMTKEQLEMVYDMYKAVLHTIRTYNKAFKAERQETIAELGNLVANQISLAGGRKKYTIKNLDFIKKLGWDNMKPVYAMKTLGSETFLKLFYNVRAGEDTWAVDVSEARDYFLDKAEKYGYKSWDFDTRYDFKSKSGKEFSLNLQEIMSLYAYSKREQAELHLSMGGFVFEDSTEIRKLKGVPVEYNINIADAHNISVEGLKDIIEHLTPEQKSFVDEMQSYMSNELSEKGNEISRALYDIELFKEKNYFPLKSASQYMFVKKEDSGEVKLKNSGFTKKTVQKANNPIVLRGFMDVWSEHVNDMSMYHAFVLPIEDFNRVWNYKTPTSDKADTESVKMVIQNAYGSQANKYISQMLTDLNGGARSGTGAGFVNKMTSLFKKGAVFASASVVIQQPSAIARAWAYIDPKYFSKTISSSWNPKNHDAIWKEVKKYAPVAIIKEMGYFDTNMGKQTTDWITATEYKGLAEKFKAFFTDRNFRDEILSKAPALADEIAWSHIWNAVKEEVADTTGLPVGSEKFYEVCGRRFTEVVVNTQVYDSVLSRSALMRSTDTGVKMATSFMAEPTTSINMLYDAIFQAKRNGNGKQARRVIGSVISQIILNSILVSLVYAARDDDDDKTYTEKYVKALSGSLLDSLNPFAMIPFIKDFWSLVQGYEVERSDMSVVSGIIDGWKNLFKDSYSPYKKVEIFVGSIANMFGLPVKNILRDLRGLWNTIETITSGRKTTSEGIMYSAMEGITGDSKYKQIKDDLMNSIGKNNTEAIKRNSKMLVDYYIDGGKNEKEAKQYVKSTLTKEWKDIFLKAYEKKDNATMEKIRRALRSTGLYEDIVKTTQDWIRNSKEDKE